MSRQSVPHREGSVVEHRLDERGQQLSQASEQTKSLAELHIGDFERTQLHKLRTEAHSLLFFTDQATFWHNFFIDGIDKLQNLGDKSHRRPQVRDIIWHDTDSWYTNLWVSVQPWWYWLMQYSILLIHDLCQHPILAMNLLRLDWLSWLAFFILGPILLLSTVLTAILQMISPSSIAALAEFGESLV